MLDVINRYLHGYVATPVIYACFKNEVFDFLHETGALSLQELAYLLKANDGHLQVAMKMFETIGWVVKNSKNQYTSTLTDDIYKDLRNIPEEILLLYKTPVQSLFKKKSYQKNLQKCFNYILNKNSNTNSLYYYLEGAVVVPLLLSLKLNSYSEIKKTLQFTELPAILVDMIVQIFKKNKWMDETKDELTDSGKFMLDRAFNFALAVSYAPMLSQIEELIFGNPNKVFLRTALGHERHINRTLNVLSSGFQHERYFADMEEIILTVFNKMPFEEQPKYIIDMGCGDGSLLKKVYEIILSKSRRSKVINEYPIYMIGVDYNKKALNVAEHKLKNIPHYLLQGNISDPEKMIMDIKNLGIEDVEKCLHVRSFLDHDRPYFPPKNNMEAKKYTQINYSGAYVDSSGKLIPPAEMVQSLVEHMSKWAEIITKHGIIILEVHCLAPETSALFFEQSESFYFDALQAFSKQYPVESDTFLIVAAEVGLFPKENFSKRYPQIFPYTRITLNYFEKRAYSLHYAQLSDIEQLLELEYQCWPGPLRIDKGEIIKRIKQFPQGQFVVRQNKKVIAVIYTQRIDDIENLKKVNSKNISSIHIPDGKLLQLIGINLSLDLQGQGIGDELLEFVLLWSMLIGGIEKLVGVSRCKNYIKHSHLSLQQYIKKHTETPGGLDSILSFHTNHGAKIINIIENYRPEDVDNLGAGILIEYDIYHRNDTSLKYSSLPIKVNQISNIVDECINELLPDKFRHQYSKYYPLREMGFDSLRLLELRTILNNKLAIKLDPTFFFEQNTPDSMIQYLQSINSMPEESGTSCNEDVSDENKIAIVGMGCRFPGRIKNLQSFWELLINEGDVITSVPEQRSKYYIDDNTTHFGGFIEDIDQFAADFFHISSREAELMDPQQRILLEVTWEALEQGGMSAEKLVGTKTGVFVGVFSHDYETLIEKNKKPEDIDAYFGTGNAESVLAGRLSYSFGFNGPALVVNTACSSSLVAVHLACQSLLHDDIDLAIAAGVNLVLLPDLNISFTKAGMLAPDGKCKAFDASANGYVRGEGCGVIVLKKLSKALADQDTILAVICGSAVNQDGASNGLTAPNEQSQEELLRNTIRLSKVTPSSISYIEAHGTGTALGDPIEMKALTTVYGFNRNKKNPLIVGSVKTNIGHTEGSAGIAGLIKTVLALQNQEIPGNLHFSKLNPYIDPGNVTLQIPVHSVSWPIIANEQRRAGVSSFGFSGTNAHLIVEEAPLIVKKSVLVKSNYIITLSAKTKKALQQKIIELDNYLADKIKNNNADILLEDISFTLNTGRNHFDNRCAIVASSLEELQLTLHRIAEGYASDNIFISTESIEKIGSDDNLSNLILDLNKEDSSSLPDYRNKLALLANYYIKGFDINWDMIHRGERRNKISLPLYPFERQSYWYDSYDEIKLKELNKDIVEEPYSNNDISLSVVQDNIAIIKLLDKKNHNQITFNFLRNLMLKFEEIKNDPNIKAVIITGYDDVFCMGGDEKILTVIAEGKIKFTDLPFIYKGFLECELPVISAMQGHAHGGGLIMGLYADIIIFSEENTYAANFMRYGFTPGVGATLILKEKLGNVANEMMLTAKLYTGEELKNRTNSIIFKKQNEVLAEAIKIAMSLAEKPLISLKMLKKNLVKNIEEKLPGALKEEILMQEQSLSQEGIKEKVQEIFSTTKQVILEEPKLKIYDKSVLEDVKKIVANILHAKIESLGTSVSFSDLGADSIAVVGIIRDVNTKFGLTLEATNLYACPTIEKFSHFIVDKLHEISALQESSSNQNYSDLADKVKR